MPRLVYLLTPVCVIRLQRVVPFCVLSGCFLFSGLTAVAADESPIVDAVSDLEQWRQSFVNLRIRYVSRFHYDEPANLPFSSSSLHCDWIWTEDRQFLEESTVYRDEVEESRQLVGMNGEVAFLAKYETNGGGPSEALSLLMLNEAERVAMAGRQGAIVVPLEGLWIASRCVWLADVVGELPLTDGGPVVVEGVPCQRLSYAVTDYLEYVLALDPAHGYLPREVTLVNSRDEGGRHRYLVQEYQRVDPGLWFPWRGSFWGANLRQDWEVEDVELNAEVEPARFDPPAPKVGTQVFDGIKGVSYVVGEGGVRVDPAPAAQTVETTSHVPITAQSDLARRWTWPAVLVVVGLVFLWAAHRIQGR